MDPVALIVAPLAAEPALAGRDDAVVATAARTVLGLRDALERPAANYVLVASKSQCVQADDGNSQVNYSIQEYFDQPREAGPPAGFLLAGMTDPFAPEVYQSVQADEPLSRLLALSVYVPREHDRQSAELVRAAADGRSGIAVPVGGSSTGKARACWEAWKACPESRWRTR